MITEHIPHEPKEFFTWFVIFFIFLWVLWFFTGGPKRAENKYNPLITPLSDTNGGKVYAPGTKPKP